MIKYEMQRSSQGPDTLRSSQGGEIRKTRITDEFDFKAYLAVENRQVWPVFAVDSKDRIYVFTSESQPEPKPGWSVIGLIKEEQKKEQDGENEKRQERKTNDGGTQEDELGTRETRKRDQWNKGPWGKEQRATGLRATVLRASRSG